MLTNDDGWQAPGITEVYNDLVDAGYQVTMVAPLNNNSGTGAQLTIRGTLTVTQPEAGKYVVDGTPADTVEFGFHNVFADNPPDLVISGSNRGQNASGNIVHSGTVGAVATSLNNGVPGIALSTAGDYRGENLDNMPYAASSDYLLTLLSQLQTARRAGDPLLPKGVGLNVNYPYLAGGTGTPAGVKLARAGTGFADFTYLDASLPEVGASSDFTVRSQIAPATPGSDDDLLDQGYITVQPIAGNYDIEYPRAVLGRLNAIFR
ncbi:MAG: 5'/3'-nucleotidase SurE [Phycicoccus sp.]|nr:5'/3'-nucleotidase SurE [Phycicoccus sp.]